MAHKIFLNNNTVVFTREKNWTTDPTGLGEMKKKNLLHHSGKHYGKVGFLCSLLWIYQQACVGSVVTETPVVYIRSGAEMRDKTGRRIVLQREERGPPGHWPDCQRSASLMGRTDWKRRWGRAADGPLHLLRLGSVSDFSGGQKRFSFMCPHQ